MCMMKNIFFIGIYAIFPNVAPEPTALDARPLVRNAG